MKKIMIDVPESDFTRFEQMNVNKFYYDLSSSDKKKVDERKDLAELLKYTPEYQHLEQAIKIILKCSYNLKSSPWLIRHHH